jgi:hypothetical protein
MEKATRRRYALEYKQEAVRLVASGQKVPKPQGAKNVTLEWLLWYNGSRMHSTLCYLSPLSSSSKQTLGN